MGNTNWWWIKGNKLKRESMEEKD